ncbi:bifunctional helix-turn-helix transcriptional regulator/GNAT family N-acetyltransferase [Arenibaculum sp.]|jgi:DNA-binding MarR family transcriptional regulator/GNAT superfamily N-acetyltransferase|uniref:bifunctional helix-turn-helix transcriptional regulator/GNAT family N-acetyltransferase n=1 Tax=Arenibaculum sp. TaxID=2865862 RepID=UPI002E129AAD|nr:bifunctional helix-turn-helix transcriptional regulator/GNAT family N-acetyltransferase [Arenibaculum sp.]
MTEVDVEGRIADVRRFNRFYTRQIGVLHEGLLKSPYSLTESRVLYELAHRDGLNAAGLAKDLGLDAGYLSRMLRAFERQGLVTRVPSPNDARQMLLSLTAAGRVAFGELNARSHEEVAALLAGLPEADRRRLTEAMRTIEEVLGDRAAVPEPYVLRPHRPGDMGWVIHRQAVLYALEYGWDERFEALVAEIAAKFVQNLDPRRERCWIAEKDGETIGSVFLVRHSDEVAKLRMLYVEPAARGLGVGRRLVEECIRFARLAGYRKITLWTNDVLVAARRIYEATGFRLVEEERHHSFGHDLMAQTWERDL